MKVELQRKDDTRFYYPDPQVSYVDDLADACVFLMEQGHAGSLLNIGTGQDVTIRELVEPLWTWWGLKGRLCLIRVSRMGRCGRW